MSMFGTELSPSHLIKKQQIAREYLATDLFFLGRIDKDWQEGYKPHIMTAETLRRILITSISILDLVDTPSAFSNPGDILQVSPAGDELIFTEPLDEFIELIDTPADYVGFAGSSVVVNQTEDGLIFQPNVTEARYEARVTFDLMNNPTVVSQLASLAPITVTFTRTSNGVYRAQFNQPVIVANLIMWIGGSDTGNFVPTAYTPTYIEFQHRLFIGGLSDANINDVSVEIKIYP